VQAARRFARPCAGGIARDSPERREFIRGWHAKPAEASSGEDPNAFQRVSGISREFIRGSMRPPNSVPSTPHGPRA
jgi:hypothetical protein